MKRLALALLLATSLDAFAATATTAITGKVMSGGAVAAGVTVTATSPALQGERTTVTTANGRYWLAALPPGDYEVTFSRGGMQTLIKSAEVQVARVTRVDATLEPSEDEESVTSTAKVVGVADTTVITSHFDDKTLDRLPVRRDPLSAASLAPGGGFGNVYQDDAFTYPGDIQGEESLEQVTVLRFALTPDHEFSPSPIYAQTRSGGEDFSFSLRDALTSDDWIGGYNPGTFDEDGLHHLFEGSAGGRIVPEKLWFFASAWHGEEWFGLDRRGVLGKLTAQLGAEHNLTATYDHGELGINDADQAQTGLVALRYLGAAGPRWTNEAVASHATSEIDSINLDPDSPRAINHTSFFGKSTYVLGTRFGDHILSAGAQHTNDEYFDNTSVFANDRWVWNRWTMNLGLRHDDEGLLPRVSASFDVHGDGRHAVIASLSDYTFGFSSGRDLTLGYATALGNSGTARVDVIRRDVGPVAFEAATFELRYSLFDRFQAAANYLWQDREENLMTATHTANGWVTLALPVGTHEFAVTALQRYRSAVSEIIGDDWSTDLALRYALPIRRVGLTLAADVLNLFDQGVFDFSIGRMYRGWVRARL
jgi:hypothetical protein